MPQKETGNTTAEIYWPAIGRFDHDVPRQEPELEHFSGGNDQWYETERFGCDTPKETEERKRSAEITWSWYPGARRLGNDLQEEN